jgi:hypothetical protein
MERLRVVGVDTDRLVVVRKCAIVVALVFPSLSALPMGLRVVGVESNRLVETRDRSVEITLAVSGDCPFAIEFGVEDCELDRLVG